MADERKSARKIQDPLWLLTIVGFLATAVGILLQITGNTALQQITAGTFTAVGGGIIGATVSIYVSASGNADAVDEIRKVVAEPLQARMISKEVDLEVVRRELHYYNQTQLDGVFVWRHTSYRFDRSSAVGSIGLVIGDLVRERLHLFRVEVAIRGTSMIIAEERMEGQGPATIIVFPNFTEDYGKISPGLAFIRTWDNTNLLAKCLVSAVSLVPDTGQESLSQEQAKELDKIWERTFRAVHRVFPLATDQP